MKISIKTLPISKMRYNTVGDWEFDIVTGDVKITVAQMGDPFYEFLVARHELDECFLCLRYGITQKEVDDFDMSWSSNESFSEPGLDPTAPYHEHHMVAYGHEMLMAQSLGVNWTDYNQRMDSVMIDFDNNREGL